MRDINEYHDLRDLVADCGGIENFRFFGRLNKYTDCLWFSKPCDDVVECKLEDDEFFSLADGYKVKAVPVNDERYANRHFYQSTLLQLIQSGHFTLKINEGDHVVHVDGYEHLCGNVYIHHQWDEVVREV